MCVRAELPGEPHHVAPVAGLPSDTPIYTNLLEPKRAVKRNARWVGDRDARKQHSVTLLFEQGEECFV